MFDISTWFVNVEPLEDKHFGKSDDVFLIVIIDFIPFQVFLILFVLISKYWSVLVIYNNLFCFLFEGYITHFYLYIAHEKFPLFADLLN